MVLGWSLTRDEEGSGGCVVHTMTIVTNCRPTKCTYNKAVVCDKVAMYVSTLWGVSVILDTSCSSIIRKYVESVHLLNNAV